MFHLRRKLWHLKELSKFWRYIELFERNSAGDAYPIYSRLCTACHILDKGLHIRNFEPGHGGAVYKRAKLLESQIPADSRIRGEAAFQWCLNVMVDYEAAQQTGAPSYPAGGYAVNAEQTAAFENLCSAEVSCRDFLPDEVSDDVWEEIVGLAMTAPNSCCRQSTRFHIVGDPEKVSKLSGTIAGATGFNRLIPYLVFVAADLRVYASCDHRLPYIDAALALDRFTLAACTRGVYLTILNFEHADKRERELVHSMLGIPRSQRIVVAAAAGRPANLPSKPGRMAVEHFLEIHK